VDVGRALIGESEHARRNNKAEGLRGFEIDDEFEFIRSKATCVAPLCEVLTSCRGQRARSRSTWCALLNIWRAIRSFLPTLSAQECGNYLRHAGVCFHMIENRFRSAENGCTDVGAGAMISGFHRFLRDHRARGGDVGIARITLRARRLIHKQGDTVERFAGDAIMALFNDPLSLLSGELPRVREALQIVSLALRRAPH
jgi:hypothetical protein